MLLSAPSSLLKRGGFRAKYPPYFLAFIFTVVLLSFANSANVAYADVREPLTHPERIVPFVEPDNQPTGFTATADSSSQITTDWIDSVAGANAPTGYLVYCSTSASIVPPLDGIDVVDDTNCADGSGAQNIGPGDETAVWGSLDPSTTYFFEIYAFIGSGLAIDYLTTTIPTASATTNGIVVLPTGTIEIIEDTVPNAGRDFSFSITGGLLPATFDLDDNGNPTLPNTQTFNAVADGTYVVTQAADTDYVTTIACTDPSGGTTTLGLAATIDLSGGETVTCTFTNTLAPTTGTIVIIENTVPNAAQNFAFSTKGGLTPSSFNLDDDSNGALSNTRTFNNVLAGEYGVAQTAVPGYTTTLVCVDPSGGTTTAGAEADIDLAAGETVTCTFTNTAQPGTIEIILDTVPNSAQNFAFTGTGGVSPITFNLDDDANPALPNTRTFNSVPAGSYSVSQAAVSGYTTSVACEDPSGGTTTTATAAAIALAPGETISCTFTNELSLPEISVSDAEVVEGDSGLVNLLFTVTRSDNTLATTVQAKTVNGSAVAGSDFNAINNQTVSFPAGGALTQNVIVKVKGDEIVEANELLTLLLTNPVNGQIVDDEGEGEITNDDSATVTLTGATAVLEGDTTKLTYIYEATLDNAVQGGFKLEKDTTSGTAKAGTDFDDNDGILTFAGNAGEVQTIELVTRPDKQVEDDEILTVKISSISNTNVGNALTLAGSPIVVTIENDDQATISLLDGVAKEEGDSGTTNFVFTAVLDNPVDGGFKIAYETDGGTASIGPDLNDKDGTLTFGGSAGETETITVQVKGDEIVEIDEIFTVALGSISNTPYLDSLSVTNLIQEGTILNDDEAIVTLSGGVAKQEGDSGTVSFTFTAKLNVEVDGGFKLAYSTEDGTAKLADNDYVDNDGVLTFSGTKDETKTITILVNGDTKGEAQETFNVVLGEATPDTDGIEINTAGSPQVGTILNDDSAVFFIEVTPDIGEEDGVMQVTVTLTGEATVGATIDYATVAGTAIAGVDYTSVAGTLNFGVGETSKTFDVPILDDDITEGDETFSVSIANPSAYGLGEPSIALITIIDDESSAIISFAEPISAGEADGQMAVTLELNPVSDVPVTVDLSSADGTATAGEDYTAIDQTVTFEAGETSKVVNIAIQDDKDAEGDETIILTLKNPMNAGLSQKATADATIIDDEIRLVASISGVTIDETNSGQKAMLFEVTLSAPIATDVTIQFATQDGTAIAGEDYVASSGTLVIPAGRQKGTIGIFILGDRDRESDETFELLLFGATGIELDAPSGVKSVTGVIQNDDNSLLTYLPLIGFRAFSQPAPDLIVDSIDTTGGVLKVTIKNIGIVAADKPFWVDLFVNPSVLPTKANDTVANLNQSGIVWGVEGSVIPLLPGESLTLQIGDQYYNADRTNYTKSIQAGDLLVAHVDSLNSSTTYGAVNEAHELINGTYNNILSTTAVR
ncbi:MAG: Calx-beta domain-containing protein [Anaerolineae bacterium]